MAEEATGRGDAIPKPMPAVESRTPNEKGGRGKLSRPNFRPDDAPSGTLPIDQQTDTKEIAHAIKKNLREDGVRSNSWVGIAPNGDVIVANPDGGESHGKRI
jgi:hypothetical protein